MAEHEGSPDGLIAAADILETLSEEIIARYQERLLAIKSPLLTVGEAWEQLQAQARAVLKEVATDLRGQGGLPSDILQEDRIPETIGVSRASNSVHAIHSLRAVVAFSEAALQVVVERLPPSRTSRSEIVAVALAVQESFMERVTRSARAYTNFLLEKAHESHADERQRISRELHDSVNHCIMVAYRSLELYEMYRGSDPSKAQEKLELAKGMTQEAFELTRNLSSELRWLTAGEGLEAAILRLMKTVAPQSLRYLVSVEGNVSLVAPYVCEELFLIIREGIRNVVTHSQAETITVDVEITENSVRVDIEDDGRGFEPREEEARPNGTGLASMKERASILGGTLSLGSARGKGTRVEVIVPLLPRNKP